jgi:hypothetical protein
VKSSLINTANLSQSLQHRQRQIDNLLLLDNLLLQTSDLFLENHLLALRYCLLLVEAVNAFFHDGVGVLGADELAVLELGKDDEIGVAIRGDEDGVFIDGFLQARKCQREFK